MFSGKAMSLPKSGAHERSFTRVGLLRAFANYGRKKFQIGLWHTGSVEAFVIAYFGALVNYVCKIFIALAPSNASLECFFSVAIIADNIIKLLFDMASFF